MPLNNYTVSSMIYKTSKKKIHKILQYVNNMSIINIIKVLFIGRLNHILFVGKKN